MELDEAFADSLTANFNAKVYGKRISVPLNHTGDVVANAGEVMKLEKATAACGHTLTSATKEPLNA